MASKFFLFFKTYLFSTLFFRYGVLEIKAENGPKPCINIVLLGATGDLAKRYLWKGFFNLYLSITQGKLDRSFIIRLYGCTREDSETGFKKMMSILETSIKCSDAECDRMKTKFKELCVYHRLKHEADFESLQNVLIKTSLGNEETEIGRIFYFSVPPFAYEDISRNIALRCRPKLPNTFVRVVLEKPFGSDLKTAKELSEKLSKYWKEDEIYRIDHYLGKAGVMQIMDFKKQNQVFFEKSWNRDNIEQVKIVVKESGDVQGRMSFYDHYGVIRDVFQNHLTEILVLVALEISDKNSENSFGNAKKSDLLKDVKRVTIHDAIFGQYDGYNTQLKQELSNFKGESNTPTFSAVLMEIQNKRWFGVPFVLVSGKNLDSRMAYVQIQFKQQRFCIKNNLENEPKNCKPREITFYIQGDKIGYPLTILSKTLPNTKFSNSWENLTLINEVSSHFKGDNIIMKPPHSDLDAYSSLIHDVFLGNKNKFVSVDDLLLSWKIWNLLLESSSSIKPRLYSKEDLESLDFEIVGGDIRFSLEPLSECEESKKYSRMDVDNGRLHSFRGNKLVSGSSTVVVEQLANNIANAIQMKIQSGNVFHMALSGGSSPKPLFQVLSYMKYIPWPKVHVWVVDERCVSVAHKESNIRNIYEYFLKHVSIPFYNIHPMPVDIAGEFCLAADLGSKQYEKLLRYHLKNGSLDFVVLGVGNDGHTASLFPGSSLLRSTNWVELTTSNSSSYERMTMTLPLLNRSKNIAVLIVGPKKYSVVQKLSQGKVDPDDLPITGLNPAHGTLIWYIDDDALYNEI